MHNTSDKLLYSFIQTTVMLRFHFARTSLELRSVLPTNYGYVSFPLRSYFARTSLALCSVLPMNYGYASFPLRCVLPTNFLEALLALRLHFALSSQRSTYELLLRFSRTSLRYLAFFALYCATYHAGKVSEKTSFQVGMDL